MKKIISVFISISLILSIFSFSVFANGSVKGDMDSNGVLSLYDAVLIHEKANKIFEKYDDRADINNDGRITSVDVSILQKAVLSNDYSGYEDGLAKPLWFSSESVNESIPDELTSKFEIRRNISKSSSAFTLHTYCVRTNDIEDMRNVVMLFTFDDDSVDFENSITFDSMLSTPRFYLWRDGQLLIGLTFQQGQKFDGDLLKFHLKSNVVTECKKPTFEILEYNSFLNGKSCFHMGGNADCIAKKNCEFCGESYGSYGSHIGGKATCSNQAVCDKCGENYGKLISHLGGTASCSEKAVCEECGQSYGTKLPHQNFDFSENCDVCGDDFSSESAGVNTSILIINDYLLYTVYFTDIESFQNISFKLKYSPKIFFNSEYNYFGEFEESDVYSQPGEIYEYHCNFVVADGYKIDEEMPILISFAFYFRDVDTFSYDDIPVMFESSISAVMMTDDTAECVFNDAVAIDCRHDHIDNDYNYFCDLCAYLIVDADCYHTDENYDCKCDVCEGPVFYYGDMDCNAKLTAADARIALRIASKLQDATEYELFVGDLDSDGKITVAEARKILRVVAQLDQF